LSEKEYTIEFDSLIDSLKQLITKIFTAIDDSILIEFRDTKFHIPVSIKSEVINIETLLETSLIEEYLSSLKQNYRIEDNSILYNDNYYENLLLGEIYYEIFSFESTDEGFDLFTLNDKENNIVYEISPVSNEYFILILKNIVSIIENFKPNTAYRLTYPYYITKTNRNKYLEKFGLLTNLRVLFNSIKIRTGNIKDLTKKKKLANSFCFKLSTSIDQSFILSKNLSKIYAKYLGSFSADYDILVPKKMFNEDLIYYYQMGLSSQLPVLQYLFYYLVIEYYFEKTFSEEWIKHFKDRINDPNFKRNEDNNIKILMEEIYSKFNYRPKSIDEQKALELILEKFVDIEKLKENIEIFDKSYFEYLKNNMPSFALKNPKIKNECLIDFCKSNVFARLAKRIYLIRNSIVHSKESFENKFKPFEDEEELSEEIPLIRLIAEDVILNSGEDIK